MSSGIILLLGNEEVGMNCRDNWYHFKQDSTFLYYIGLNQASLAAIIDIDNNTTTVYGDELTVDDVVWTGPQDSIAQLSAEAGIESTAPHNDVMKALQEAQAKGRTIHLLPPYRDEHTLKLHQWLGLAVAEIAHNVSLPLIKAIVAQREIKTAEELVELDKAVDITADMHLAAMTTAKAGMMEYEVSGTVQSTAMLKGGDISFPIILTTNGQTLHNHYHGNVIEAGRLLLCDSGAQTSTHYAGDMTRTFPVDGTFSQKQKEVYTVLLQSHEVAVAAMKPGVPYKEVHLLAAKTIFNGLKQIGLTRGDTDEAVAQGVHALFFPHGLGHQMGMDVHDMENLGEVHVGYDGQPKSTQFGLKSLRLGKPLKEGFVLTVEPGIYLIPELIDSWRSENKFIDFLNYDKLEGYKDFGGMRVEEDFVITANGSRRLGKKVATSIADIEAIRQEAIG
jgi:Xaa-Pro aminopeptidase